MSVRFVMNEAAFQNLIRGPSGMVGQDLRRRGRLLEGQAKRQVGVKTGLLRASIDHEIRMGARGLAVRVGSPVPYALLHHEGSRAHTIVPRVARALSFNVRGKRVTARIVRHPGTQPNRYLTDHLAEAVLR